MKPKRKYLSIEQISSRLSQPKATATVSITPSIISWASLINHCPVAYDQGQLGSCVANALCHSYKIICNATKNSDFNWDPSRLWVYYWARVVENPGSNPSTLADTGCNIADADSYSVTNGICSESLYPYIESQYDATPSALAIADAPHHEIASWQQIPIDSNLTTSIENLLLNNQPVMIAINVYSSFESAQTGQTGFVPMPNPTNYRDPNDPVDPYYGGHEVVIVGFNRTRQEFIVLNSWGKSWGINGYIFFPYAYIANSSLMYQATVITLKTSTTNNNIVDNNGNIITNLSVQFPPNFTVSKNLTALGWSASTLSGTYTIVNAVYTDTSLDNNPPTTIYTITNGIISSKVNGVTKNYNDGTDSLTRNNAYQLYKTSNGKYITILTSYQNYCYGSHYNSMNWSLYNYIYNNINSDGSLWTITPSTF